jgi:hypothetical protein
MKSHVTIILNRHRFLLKIGTSVKKGADQSLRVLDFIGQVVATKPIQKFQG